MINEFSEMIELTKLINIFSLAVPEGTNSSVEIEGEKIHLIKKDGKIKIEIEHPEESFNDSETKKIVKNYRENIEELDDSLFIEVIEKIKEKIDIKKLNDLLDLEHFTKEQSESVLDMIYSSSEVISSLIEEKIQELTKLHSRF